MGARPCARHCAAGHPLPDPAGMKRLRMRLTVVDWIFSCWIAFSARVQIQGGLRHYPSSRPEILAWKPASMMPIDLRWTLPLGEIEMIDPVLGIPPVSFGVHPGPELVVSGHLPQVGLDQAFVDSINASYSSSSCCTSYSKALSGKVASHSNRANRASLSLRKRSRMGPARSSP